MKQIAITLLSSKKFSALLVTLLVLVATRKLGLDEETATEVSREIVALVGTFMVGQGIADHGKGKAEQEGKRPAVTASA